MTDTARPSVRGTPFPVKLAMGLAVMLYRFTDGGIGGRTAGNPELLLTTIGRKSKKAHTIPLAYFEAMARSSSWPRMAVRHAIRHGI